MEISFDDIATQTLTKANLSKLLFDQIGLNKREAKDFIDAFFEQIIKELSEGRDVKISGFANFELASKKTRPGRNPRTGESVQIEARRKVSFHASPKLKSGIQKIRDPRGN